MGFDCPVGGPFCPVAIVEELLFEGVYLGAGPLIRLTCVSPRGQYFKAQQPCYTTVNEWFKVAAVVLGLDPSKYGTHSGRKGGATRAANVDILIGCSKPTVAGSQNAPRIGMFWIGCKLVCL